MINRNNYEEYFLLYADKELSVNERNAVEDFVNHNPDLEEEFLMIQQSILKPGNITLDDKKFLLKDQQFITRINYEEKFILYNDDELSFSEKNETENFVKQNTSFQNEFELFQQIKYQPDTSVNFPDKRSLLKREDKVKVIPLNWLKALAAAVLLGFGLWMGINHLQKIKPDKIFATHQNVKPSLKITDSVKREKEINNFSTAQKINTSFQKLYVKNVTEKRPVKKQSSVKENLVTNDPVESQKRTAQKNENVSQQSNNDIAFEEPQRKTDPVIPTTDIEKPVDASISKIDKRTINALPEPETIASSASYKESEEKSDNYVFYNITEEQFNKSKVGAFFKKIKSVIDKRNVLKEKIFKSDKQNSNTNNL